MLKRQKSKFQNSKLEEEGPLLITHWGLSGPAVLRLSAWGARELKERNWEFGISVNWLPDFNEQSLKEKFLQLRNTNASQKIIIKILLDCHQDCGNFWQSNQE